MLISLSKYAAAHGRSQISVQQKARRGGFETARKIGRNWVIDSEEPYVKMKKGELQMHNAGIAAAKAAGQKSKLK